MEQASAEQLCRLCLNAPTDYLEDLTSKVDILKVVRLDVEISLTETPGICTRCSEILQQCLDFKLLGLNTENTLDDFFRERTEAKMNLNELLQITGAQVNGPERVCRYCLNSINTFVNLEGIDKDGLLKDMIDMCLPEFSLEMIEQPSMCLVCMEKLQTFYNFMVECQENDERVKNYILCNGSNSKGHVNLNDVVKIYRSYAEENDIEEDSDCMEVKRIKVEGDNSHWSVILDGQINAIDCEFNAKRVKSARSRKPAKDNPYLCELCPRPFNAISARSLQLHMTKAHKGMTPPYICEYCDYSSFVKELVEKHIITYLKRAEGPGYRCHKCDFKTHKRRQWYDHLSMHGDFNDRNCPKCPKKFNKQVNLDGHILMSHPELEDSIESKVYRCYVCGFKTVHKRDWKPHDSCQGIVRHECEECGFTTPLEYYLVKHKLRGHKYSCDVCGMKFSQKSELTSHVKKHSSEQWEYLQLVGEDEKTDGTG